MNRRFQKTVIRSKYQGRIRRWVKNRARTGQERATHQMWQQVQKEFSSIPMLPNHWELWDFSSCFIVIGPALRLLDGLLLRSGLLPHLLFGSRDRRRCLGPTGKATSWMNRRSGSFDAQLKFDLLISFLLQWLFLQQNRKELIGNVDVHVDLRFKLFSNWEFSHILWRLRWLLRALLGFPDFLENADERCKVSKLPDNFIFIVTNYNENNVT